MSKIVVTGGAGFIGSHLVDLLVRTGHEVMVLDDLSGGSLDNFDEANVQYYQMDLRDSETTDQVMQMFGPEIVYHLAANPAENKAQFSPIDITTRGWNTFINVLTSFIKYGGRKFIFTSSIAVYGNILLPYYEASLPCPEDLYGITKLASEQALMVMSEVHDFEYLIVRPHNVYGARQSARDPYRNVITIWMNAILKGEPITIYGDGSNTRQYSFVDHVVQGLFILGLGEEKNTIYNIGSDQPTNLSELAQAIQEVTKTQGEIVHLPGRVQEVPVAIEDHNALRMATKLYDPISLAEGLQATWEYMQEIGPQEKIFTPLEIPSDKAPQNWRRDV